MLCNYKGVVFKLVITLYEGGGIKKLTFLRYIIYGWPLTWALQCTLSPRIGTVRCSIVIRLSILWVGGIMFSGRPSVRLCLLYFFFCVFL